MIPYPQMMLLNKQCNHLSPNDKLKLSKLLERFPTLFPSKLGCYNKTKFILELKDPKINPIFCKPCPRETRENILISRISCFQS